MTEQHYNFEHLVGPFFQKFPPYPVALCLFVLCLVVYLFLTVDLFLIVYLFVYHYLHLNRLQMTLLILRSQSV